MTKILEETFNLPPTDMNDKSKEDTDLEELDEDNEVDHSSQDLVEYDQRNSILSKVNEDTHELEVDEIRKKALSAYEDIMEVGKNVNPERSARLFEVAGQFLKASLDAANSKSEKQLKVAKLKLEAAKLKINEEMMDQISSGREVMADRNELLKQMMAESKNNIVDVNAEEE